NPIVVGAGASGALFGILTSLASWVFIHRRILPPPLLRFWVNRLVTVLVLNLGITFGISGISKGAHLAGAIAGLVVAFPLAYLRFAPPGRKWLAMLGIAAVPALSLFVLAEALAGRSGLIIVAYQQHEEAAKQHEEVAKINEALPGIEQALTLATVAERVSLQ